MARPRKNAPKPNTQELSLVPVEEQPYSLPEDWKWVRLGSLARTISKGTTPKGGKEAYLSSGVAFLRVENIHEDGTICHDNIAHVSIEQHLNFLKRSILEAGDILVSIAGTLGRTGIVREVDLPLNTNQAVSFVRLKNGISNKYIRFFINSPIAQQLLLAQTKVTSIPNLTLEIINNCSIPLPPLDEQERIVTRIESLFAKLDEAKEKTEAVLDSYETRKAAILHKAFTGELTAKWREERGIEKESWKSLPFCALGSSKLGKMLDKQKNKGTPIPYLRNINVRWFSFDLSETAEMLATPEEVKLLSVKQGDLFICEGGEPGRCAVWKDEERPLIFQKALHRFRPNELASSDFLCFLLNYYATSRKLDEFFTGTTIKHLTGQSLAKIQVPVPTLPEQQEIIRILDSLLEKEQQSKEAAETVLEQIDLMKKAILAKAFRGELG